MIRKIFLLFVLIVSLCSACLVYKLGETNFHHAQHKASQLQRPLLLIFSGSDWCRNCIKLENEVLKSDAFQAYADENIIIYNADKPILKKHKLPAPIKKTNDSLMIKYNPSGIYPYVVLIQNEKKLGAIGGYNGASPQQYIKKLKGWINDQ